MFASKLLGGETFDLRQPPVFEEPEGLEKIVTEADVKDLFRIILKREATDSGRAMGRQSETHHFRSLTFLLDRRRSFSPTSSVIMGFRFLRSIEFPTTHIAYLLIWLSN